MAALAPHSSYPSSRLPAITTACLLASLVSLGGCRSVAGYSGSGPDGASSEGPRPVVDGARRDGNGQDEAGSFPDGLAPGPDSGMDLLDGRDRGSPVADGSPKDAKPVLDQGKPPKDLYAVDAKITPVDSSVDSAPLGQWFSVDKAVCPTFCFSRGLSNVASPEGAKCASGEIRPLSALKAGLSFPYGCFGDCALASGSAGAKSTLGWCYMPGQSMDADPSDYTIGCFCK